MKHIKRKSPKHRPTKTAVIMGKAEELLSKVFPNAPKFKDFKKPKKVQSIALFKNTFGQLEQEEAIKLLKFMVTNRELLSKQETIEKEGILWFVYLYPKAKELYDAALSE